MDVELLNKSQTTFRRILFFLIVLAVVLLISYFGLKTRSLLIPAVLYMGLFLISIKWPEVGLGILLLSFSYSKYIYFLPYGISTSLKLDDFAFVPVLFSWLIHLLNGRAKFKKTILNVPLLIFLLICTISAITVCMGKSGSPLYYTIFFTLRLYQYVIVYFIVLSYTNYLMEKKLYNFFLILIWIGALFVGIYGVLQYWRILPGSSYYSSLTSSLSYNRAHLGLYMLIIIFFSIGLFLNSKTMLVKVILVMSILLFFFVFLKSDSRVAWFGFIGGLLVFARYKKGVAIILILIGTIILMVAFNMINIKSRGETRKRIESIFNIVKSDTSEEIDVSASNRIQTWKNTLKLISESVPNFIFGVGFMQFKFAIEKYEYATGAHNNFLHYFAELGLIGLGAFLLLIFALFKGIVSLVNKTQFFNDRNIFIMYFCFLSGIFITLFTQESLSPQYSLSSFLGYFFFISALIFGRGTYIEKQ